MAPTPAVTAWAQVTCCQDTLVERSRICRSPPTRRKPRPTHRPSPGSASLPSQRAWMAPGLGRALPGSEALGAAARLSHRSWPCCTGKGSHSSGTRSAGGRKEGVSHGPSPSREGGLALALLSPSPQQQSTTDLSPLPSLPHKCTRLTHATG